MSQAFAEPSSPGGQERLVLHVGCGHFNPRALHAHFQTPGWREVRLDIDPSVKPDIVASITSMPMVRSAFVDAVWSSHNLEHLQSHEVPLALREFHRVIKPGGFALITLPDLQAVAQLVANDMLEDVAYVSPAGPIAALDMLYGFRPALAMGNYFMAHRTGFTAKTLTQALLNAGFTQVQRLQGEQFSLWFQAFKGM